MQRKWLCWAVAAGAALLACGNAASASAPQQPGLNWVRLPGAESCIAAAALARRVEQRLGRKLFVAAEAASMFVDGHVRRTERNGWDVTLEVSDPQGTVVGRRELHFQSARCSAIEESVILVIAVTLDPEAGVLGAGMQLNDRTRAQLDSLFGEESTEPEPPSPEPAPATSSVEAASSVESPASGASQRAAASVAGDRSNPAPLPEPATVRSRVPALDISGVGGLGQMPSFDWGLGLHLLIRVPWLGPIEVGVMTSFPQTHVVRRSGGEVPLSGQTQFQKIAGSLAACPLSVGDRAALSLCAGAELGRIRSQPRFEGLVNEPASGDIMFEVFTAGVLRLQLWSALFARTAVEVGVPLPRFRYVTEVSGGRQEIFRMSPVNLRFAVGVGWRL